MSTSYATLFISARIFKNRTRDTFTITFNQNSTNQILSKVETPKLTYFGYLV